MYGDMIAKHVASQAVLVEALHGVRRNDKTPTFEYGEPRQDGENPEPGERWLTPRIIAHEILTDLPDAVKAHREYVKGLEEALAFYADTECHRESVKDDAGNVSRPIDGDGGEHARKALHPDDKSTEGDDGEPT